jgi:hypothetical protein
MVKKINGMLRKYQLISRPVVIIFSNLSQGGKYNQTRLRPALLPAEAVKSMAERGKKALG